MRVMITGASGLIASSLAQAWRGEDVLALRHPDLDITDGHAVDAIVDRFRPDLVINGAVIGVDTCEADPALAERVNVAGPAHLAAAAARAGAAIVHFSSNYVFDGARTSGVFYDIDDEPHPINVYGATKLAGERAVIAAASRAFVIRTSWVFGRGKDSFLATVAAKLARGERMRAIGDTFASTTYVADLTARVIDLVRRGSPGIHHAVNQGVCSYETFAIEAARLRGVTDRSLIEVVSESRVAPRPRWTPMRCVPPMRSWQEALAEYVTRS